MMLQWFMLKKTLSNFFFCMSKEEVITLLGNVD